MPVEPERVAEWRGRLAAEPAVTKWRAVDDGDIELARVAIGDVTYNADPPLCFRVRYDPEDDLYDLEGDFDLSLSADSRPGLLRELDEALAMLRVEYATEQPDRLSPKARELRNELLARLRAA